MATSNLIIFNQTTPPIASQLFCREELAALEAHKVQFLVLLKRKWGHSVETLIQFRWVDQIHTIFENMKISPQNFIFINITPLMAPINLVSYAAVFSSVTPGALRDGTKNGCVGDYHKPHPLKKYKRQKNWMKSHP